MKTVYCLGGAPQFRLPCIRYNYLIKEKERKNIKNINSQNKENQIIKDFHNMNINTIEENEKEKLVDQWMDQIYPIRSIKRCLQINPTIKLKMRKFYKTLRESLSVGKNKTTGTINKNDNNNNIEKNKSPNIININNDNKLHNLKYVFDRNNNNGTINSYNKKYEYNSSIVKKGESNKMQNPSGQSRNSPKNTQTDLSSKLFNYNYPISNNNSSLDICQSLISKHISKRNSKLLSNSNNNSFTPYNNTKIIYNGKFSNNLDNNNKTEISKSYNNKEKININELNRTAYKTIVKHSKSKKMKKNNSIEDFVRKRRRRRWQSQQNKLNIIYSENEEQFYRKYDKYRKNKFLNGLGLTHVNCSPKIVLKELDQKINLIKNKVGLVKSIVDKTFPKVLANISLTKKEFEKSQGKEGYNSPYIEKLNKIKKEQNNMDLYFSIPVEIISRNRNNFKKKKKLK